MDCFYLFICFICFVTSQKLENQTRDWNFHTDYNSRADTDSGLGRATPPRRAPSPGMGSMRHLPSPSGPGSLPPGLMTKRRVFDDGSSDISSTPSSMMDYNGELLFIYLFIFAHWPLYLFSR